MTDKERDELRALQNKWLALSVVQHQIRNHGEDHQIAGAFYATDNPTFRDVKTKLFPRWREWFSDFFT